MPDYRTLYKSAIDFNALAIQDADFARHYKDNKLDFTDAAAVKQLTISLLKRDFGLDVRLPDDRLCPPVPNRLNYILWMQDLVDTTSESLSETYEPDRQVIGLDMFELHLPIVGMQDEGELEVYCYGKNLEYARGNIKLNDLDDRIKVYESTSSGPLVPLDVIGIKQIDFVMTNPPFYTSTASMLESAKAKSRPPFSACTGAEIEMVVPGGEVAFVHRLITESLVLRERVQWYSAMLGKLESVRELLDILKKKGLDDTSDGKQGTANWAVNEFVQGSKTRRWALAWSWGKRRPAMRVARGTHSVGKQLLPFPSLFSFEVTGSSSAEDIGEQIDELMGSLDLRWKYRPILRAGVAFAEKNVWSRAARRNKDRKMDVDVDSDDSGARVDEPALAAKLTIQKSTEATNTTTVDIRWLIGSDTVLYESFCGMIKREITKRNQ